MNPRWYILNGQELEPATLEEHAKWLSVDPERRRVAGCRIGDADVSTVFLGLDHNWLGGPPLLFETMVFGGEHDGYCQRCSTWKQAEVQHEEACSMIRGRKQ